MTMREIPSDVSGASAGAVRQSWDEYRAEQDRLTADRTKACARWCEQRRIPLSMGLVGHLLFLRELEPALTADELEKDARAWVAARAARKADR